MAEDTKRFVPWVRRAQWLEQIIDDKELRSAAIRLASALCCFASERTLAAFPSQTTLAAKAGIADRTLRLELTALQDHGHLEVRNRGRKASIYRLILDPSSGIPMPVISGNPMPDSAGLKWHSNADASGIPMPTELKELNRRALRPRLVVSAPSLCQPIGRPSWSPQSFRRRRAAR